MPNTENAPKKTLGEGMRVRLEALPEHRRTRLVEMWNDMTPREQMLFKEGAVMGFVRGSMHAEARATRVKHPDLFPDEAEEDRIPPDSAIVLDVLGGCDAFPDIYPTVTGYEADDDAEESTHAVPPGQGSTD